MNDIPLSTEELARLVKIKPSSIRVHYCERGHYFGLVPIKLPNGRLLWPADALERIAAYRKTKSGEGEQ